MLAHPGVATPSCHRRILTSGRSLAVPEVQSTRVLNIMRFLDLDRLPNQAATTVLDIEALQYLMCVHHSTRKDSLQVL
jgi:hypothetical protein